MTFPLEVAANAVTAVSILLAARNSLHTWWTGIVGCCLFALLFQQARLYADVTLQVFFVLTSAWGWWHWRGGRTASAAAPVRHAAPGLLAVSAVVAGTVTLGYGLLLHRYTEAYAPFADSAVLGFSVVGQVLLMQRRIAAWPAWLVVNSVAVPLFASRGLHLTAVLYAAYWCNAWHGWWHWGTLLHRRQQVLVPSAARGSGS